MRKGTSRIATRAAKTVLAGTLLALSAAFAIGCDDGDQQREPARNQVAEDARAVKETAQAANAIVHLSGVTDGPCNPDPTTVLPDADGIGDILEALLGAF